MVELKAGVGLTVAHSVEILILVIAVCVILTYVGSVFDVDPGYNIIVTTPYKESSVN